MMRVAESRRDDRRQRTADQLLGRPAERTCELLIDVRDDAELVRNDEGRALVARKLDQTCPKPYELGIRGFGHRSEQLQRVDQRCRGESADSAELRVRRYEQCSMTGMRLGAFRLLRLHRWLSRQLDDERGLHMGFALDVYGPAVRLDESAHDVETETKTTV